MRYDLTEEKLIADFDKLFRELETERAIAQEIHKKFDKIIKIRRIYVRPKGSKNAYYQITYEKDERN